MMTFIAALVFTILLLLSVPAAAWDEPDSFVGIKWGATSEEGLAALSELLAERGTYSAEMRVRHLCRGLQRDELQSDAHTRARSALW